MVNAVGLAWGGLRVLPDRRALLGERGEGLVDEDANGLVNMRKRAKTVGGTLELKSVPGEGASLTLVVRLESSKPLSVLRGIVSRRFR